MNVVVRDPAHTDTIRLRASAMQVSPHSSRDRRLKLHRFFSLKPTPSDFYHMIGCSGVHIVEARNFTLSSVAVFWTPPCICPSGWMSSEQHSHRVNYLFIGTFVSTCTRYIRQPRCGRSGSPLPLYARTDDRHKHRMLEDGEMRKCMHSTCSQAGGVDMACGVLDPPRSG